MNMFPCLGVTGMSDKAIWTTVQQPNIDKKFTIMTCVCILSLYQRGGQVSRIKSNAAK
jgi:hypothetical protein